MFVLFFIIDLLRNGFGDHKIYHCLIIEHVTSARTIPVGFTTFYFVFSIWVGKQLYLEDIYIISDHRSESM